MSEQARVKQLESNFWQVTFGERWYTAAFDDSRRTISGKWTITSDLGRGVDFWGPTGQKVVKAIREAAS